MLVVSICRDVQHPNVDGELANLNSEEHDSSSALNIQRLDFHVLELRLTGYLNSSLENLLFKGLPVYGSCYTREVLMILPGLLC